MRPRDSSENERAINRKLEGLKRRVAKTLECEKIFRNELSVIDFVSPSKIQTLQKGESQVESKAHALYSVTTVLKKLTHFNPLPSFTTHIGLDAWH